MTSNKEAALTLAKGLAPEISEIDVYLCPECGEEYQDEDQAHQCCPRDIETATRYQCPECSQLHEDQDSAFMCCDEKGK